MISKAKTVKEYLAELPEDRRADIGAIRKVILANLPKGMEEGMAYGMISYYVPHSIYPKGYHCDPKMPLGYAGLASQKNYMSFYVMTLYGDPKRAAKLREDFAKRGKKLDMGKCCVRFKKLENLPLDVIGKTIGSVTCKSYIALVEASLKK
jgi:hypothetical protein